MIEILSPGMNEPVEDAVSVWIEDLKNTDESAAEKIWNHFFVRLHSIAKKKLNAKTNAVYDEEDAAQSAFLSFCSGIAAGRFPDLNDRQSLWKLLLVITSRKVAKRHKFDRRQKRDVGRVLSDSGFAHSTNEDLKFAPKTDFICREPSPDFVAEFTETCDTLFNQLGDASLQQTLKLRLEGYTIIEVAERMNCSRRTVQRSMELIRRRWQELEPGDE